MEKRKLLVDYEIEKAEKSISDFANQVKNGKYWESNQYQEKQKESIET